MLLVALGGATSPRTGHAQVAAVDSLATSTTPRPLAALTSEPPRPLAAFPQAREAAWRAGLLRTDRLQHMGFSFALTSALIIVTREPAAAAGAALAFGLGKESWDGRGASGFDPVDLAADATGVGLSLVLVRARGY